MQLARRYWEETDTIISPINILSVRRIMSSSIIRIFGMKRNRHFVSCLIRKRDREIK